MDFSQFFLKTNTFEILSFAIPKFRDRTPLCNEKYYTIDTNIKRSEQVLVLLG